MRRLLLIIALLCLPAFGVNKTVKAGGGGDYTTIQACATAISAGDTCTVYDTSAGHTGTTYSETVTVSAGTAGNYKTITVNAGDTVYVLGFTIASYNKIIGFQVQNPSSPASANCITIGASATDIYITGNRFYACGSSAQVAAGTDGVVAHYASYVRIQNNTFSYSCSVIDSPDVCYAILARGDHWLVEGNDISHSVIGINRSGGGSYGVFRNNIFHNNPTTDCIPQSSGGHGANCHYDFWLGEPSSTTQNNVVEGNTVTYSVSSANQHFSLAQGDVCAGACRTLITRFNSITGGSAGIVNDNSANNAVNPGFYHVKSYNNTWVDVGASVDGGVNAFTHNSTNGANINDIFYYGGAFNEQPIMADDRAAGGSTCATYIGKNNIAYSAGSGTIYSAVYTTGVFTATTCGTSGNLNQNPSFTNYATGDYTLAGGSPARQAGTSLTTVTSGCGTANIVVPDASFFYAGDATLSNTISADVLRIGTTNTYTVSSIDYTTNTITFTGSVTCSAGDGVYLYSNTNGTQVLFNTNPDIGAFQAGVSSPGCTLSASPSVIKNGTSSTLTFTPSNNPTTCLINNGVGSVSCSGATPLVSPTSQTTYTATVSNVGGSNTCSAAVSIGGVKLPANVKLSSGVAFQ